jgi:mannan endo-1,4-beta-mannosidase
VNEIPTDNSTWFQHIAPNGVVTINEGSNGLKKLDTIVAAAEQLGLYIHFSLTNNWNPAPNASTTARPRNSLSNAYGSSPPSLRFGPS